MKIFEDTMKKIIFFLLLLYFGCNDEQGNFLIIDELPQKINIQYLEKKNFKITPRYYHGMLEGYEIRKSNVKLKLKNIEFNADLYSLVGKREILKTLVLRVDHNTADTLLHRLGGPIWYPVQNNSQLYINDEIRTRFLINSTRDTLVVTKY